MLFNIVKIVEIMIEIDSPPLWHTKDYIFDRKEDLTLIGILTLRQTPKDFVCLFVCLFYDMYASTTVYAPYDDGLLQNINS